jgi:hypothetical protein
MTRLRSHLHPLLSLLRLLPSRPRLQRLNPLQSLLRNLQLQRLLQLLQPKRLPLLSSPPLSRTIRSLLWKTRSRRCLSSLDRPAKRPLQMTRSPRSKTPSLL